MHHDFLFLAMKREIFTDVGSVVGETEGCVDGVVVGLSSVTNIYNLQ